MAAPDPYKPGKYNDPAGGVESSIGPQTQTQYWMKQALIDARKEAYFGQLASVFGMPKHYGKKIVRMHYIPLLDDRNINDQGIDASGATIANGNLYGSSRDVGTIVGKMPTLTEVGGRVNRVGFKRVLLEGKLEKYGFFREYTQESLDFDSDAELDMHVGREMLKGANEMTEDLLQIDLLNSAGVVRYPGAATQDSEVDATTEVTYDSLMRLNIDLDNNRAPKGTKMITGTRMIDTRTIPGCRPLYCGSELIPTLKAMKDNHGNPAFISIEKYAAGGNTFIGEIGAIDQFRIIINPQMMHWQGAGKAVDPAADGYHDFNDKYSIFPMLVISSEAFTTVGFQTDGKNVKFKIYNKKPGEATADRLDPYGEMGFMSIKWYYGFMVYRPEWIALIKTVARL
ncbi:major capsid protein [Pseudomonas phage Ka3]|uniref:Major capsid protein n=3 Tax=root TaxID=1 RepID=CAPSD_BPK21|nr:major head protein [Pseudomonas phage KPP21]A0A0H5AXT3.1 RecName: Full=Major capsid protein; AltName: Full=Major virion protein [Pseudomonas phage KPP21]QKE55973.1 major capsid protein [Pseudomonas phage vB_Pae_AM.P2]UGL60887.1 major capsid protein [Pseudomonas phage vB_PaeS_TUMS_P6]UNI71969.1 major capsid protein [Pseudomonas phage vB_PaeP_TUMS_P10]WQZ52377.1 major capsid protein [Pseudomonas phage Ka3]BAR94566.1 major virion protein [Pseudomonas phage KPP21]